MMAQSDRASAKNYLQYTTGSLQGWNQAFQPNTPRQ